MRRAISSIDECGAVEWFTHGAKLVTLDGADGKLTPDAMEAALARFEKGSVHHAQPAAVSITQATRARHGLSRGRDRRDRAHGARPRPEAAHGRRAFRQCARPSGLRAGRDHLARGRRRALLRRHQERRGGRGGGRLLRSRKRAAISTGGARRPAISSPSMRFVSAQLEAYLADGCGCAMPPGPTRLRSAWRRAWASRRNSPSRRTRSSRACPTPPSRGCARAARNSTTGSRPRTAARSCAW